MRKHPFIIGSYYHIYNRGVDKRDVFINIKDVERFLLCMELFSYESPVLSIQVALRNTPVNEIKNISNNKGDKIISIVEYCLNPNHFHFILKQEKEGGISEFMKRLQGGYTKYFNEKYNRSGSLFQGTFKSVYAEREQYFEKIFAYVMWNYKIHNIPTNKLHLIKSSEDEYKSGLFTLIDKKEGRKFLNWFGGFEKFKRCGEDIISMIRDQREIPFDFHEN